MTPEKLLARIADARNEGGEQAEGGIALIRIDRVRQLRRQLGFGELFRLVRQVSRELVNTLDGQGEVRRFGLSAFVVVIPAVAAADLQALAERMFKALTRRVFEVGDDSMAITVSLAVAAFDHRFAGTDRMLVALSERVEAVTAEGGNALTFVEPGVSSTLALDSEDHMLGLLMDALQGNNLTVVFQPLLATSADESTRAFQMLPRLKASDGHLIAAAEFIPVAREARLLPVLDRWMVTHALKLLKGPMDGQDIRLFVNQSDAVLTDPDRLAWLDTALGKAGRCAHGLVIELRLDDAMAHLKYSAKLIDRVREHGGQVCLSRVDDHSRWDLLGESLACDFLRMSPGFVTRLCEEPDMEKHFLTLSESVRRAGARVIMPMIEDQKTAARMWRSGADYMQGNMIQEPEDTIALEE